MDKITFLSPPTELFLLHIFKIDDAFFYFGTHFLFPEVCFFKRSSLVSLNYIPMFRAAKKNTSCCQQSDIFRAKVMTYTRLRRRLRAVCL